MRVIVRSLPLSAVALLLVAAPALADVPARRTPDLLLTQSQMWTIVIGLVVPLVTYVINRVGPWVSEPVKAAVLTAASALAAAAYTALDTNVIGFNAATAQLLLFAVLASFTGHKLIWKPAGVAARLGADVAATDPPAKR